MAYQGQDWNVVVINKKTKSKPKAADINSAIQRGAAVETVRKYAAGTNRTGVAPIKPAHLLEDDDAEIHVPHVDVDMRIKIQQARTAKGLTQKELATQINERATVISDYESGRAIPNPAVLTKIERALGVSLRGAKKKKKAPAS
eukprot:TRINITY_DN162_c0_g1_i1.p1 TRINITY_DN162_c0_g1~~TRINITY_DN162_c0_g1_i1.p1  ORF type:complete len:169 (-),score=70.96 TRINITY_DN162_c0_g1_i1:150-581(-)